MDYKSCETLPLCCFESDSTLVWKKYPVMSLHTMLGIVNDIYDFFDSQLETLRRRKLTTFKASDWAMHALSLKREKYFGGNFHGNQCNKLLESIEVLETLLYDGNILDRCVDTVNALKAFKLVKDACFGMELDSQYQTHIKSFAQAYKKLGLNVTPKSHDLFAHTIQFLEFMKSKGINKGLAYWGEQAVESVHRAWDELWENQSRELNHPDYAKQLFLNCVRFSSRRIGTKST